MTESVAFKEPVSPKCQDCGRTTWHCVSNGHGGHVWLCGSCEYRREHPKAKPRRPMPQERRPLPLQEERLFPVT